MRILTVNTGSTSVKLNTVNDHSGAWVSENAGSHAVATSPKERETWLAAHLAHDAGPLDAVAHRVVHGGTEFTAPVRIDEAVSRHILRLAEFAPLHNPGAHAWVTTCQALLGDALPQIGVFDTAWYAELPPAARAYALPEALTTRHGIRRFGFHGIAHRALWERWREVAPAAGARLISFQLGGGCSVTAVHDGLPLETSMGFSPLEGLVMATRSGDLDPTALTCLMRREGWSPEQADRVLNEESGIKGVAGSADLRELLARGDTPAQLALDLYVHRLRKYLGAYLAVLGGTDGIVFGGGVGEHATVIRERVLRGFEWAGIHLDAQANRQASGGEARLDAGGVSIWVLKVDEAAQLATEAATLLG